MRLVGQAGGRIMKQPSSHVEKLGLFPLDIAWLSMPFSQRDKTCSPLSIPFDC